LFNLSSSRQFTNTDKGGIGCRSNCGPAFGNKETGAELCAYEPFNVDGKCGSYANQDGYKIDKEGGKNMLTNNKDGNFTISEIEVWEVVNVENLELK
jgi:hypothetical protein